MEKSTRKVTFVDGPLDGQTRDIDTDQMIYKHEQPPVSDDIHIGEVPVGFFPPIHEYIYVQSETDSDVFKYKEQHHQ